MKTFTGGQVEGGQVKVDNNIYLGVTFTRCKLIYAGTNPVIFQNCNFVDCSWGFIGAASATVTFLQHLFNEDSGAEKIGADILDHISNQKLVPFEPEEGEI